MTKLFLQINIVLLITISNTSLIYASKSNDFVTFLSQKIHNDCKGQRINLKSDSILGIAIRNDPNIVKLKPLPEFITIDSTKHNIYELVKVLPRHEPYITYANYPENPYITTGIYGSHRIITSDKGEEIKFSNSGLGVINCRNKTLDVNGDQYFWNKKLIEVPKIQNNYNLTLLGLNLIQDGGITIIGISVFYLGLISISLLSIEVIFVFIRPVRKKVIMWLKNRL